MTGKNDIIKIYIDPRCNSVYSSYYIRGLRDFFGGISVEYKHKYFKEVVMSHLVPNIKDPNGGDDPRILLFILVTTQNQFKKVAIDYRDNTVIFQQAYGWCDIYAKINYNRNETPHAFQSKILCIAPSFGIHYGLAEVFKVLFNGLKCYFPIPKICTEPKIYIRNTFSPYIRRFPISAYTEKISSKNNYVFFISSLWNKSPDVFTDYNNDIESVNNWRIQYIRCVKNNSDLTYEGGLFGNHVPTGCNDLIFTHFVPTADYIRKTKESLFVFNTPAVWGCHGWKLGEFLAMGKAIISTPLKNDLPAPLTHGENIHIVKTISELKEAVDLLSTDSEYRKKLEVGASEYFKRWCAPASVVDIIFSQI
jgi:hypothetical protein